VPDGSPGREQFIQGFVSLQAIWEFLDPNPLLAGAKSSYLWLAKLYQSVLPRDHSKTFLWEKYGAKTKALIHASMSNVRVTPKPGRKVTLDAAGLALVKRIAEQLRLVDAPTQSEKDPGDVFQDVLDSIEARLKRRVEDADAAVYKSLADRIEKLREQAITNVEESLAFLEEALQIARDVVAADRAAEEGNLELYDPKTGALTQIVEENTPPGLHKIVPDIVHQIDSIVVEVAFAGWHENTDGDKKVRRELRSTLKHFGLPVTGPLFDKTYAYVRENY
jgi:type I restriction enzyme R subunit